MTELVFDGVVSRGNLKLSETDSYTKDEISKIIRSHCLQYFGTTVDFYLLKNGRIYDDDSQCGGGTIRIVPRLLGGKGGFGSMLRAIGAQIEKTTNREACRDLSGRRLRDINEEKRLKKWLSEQAEREQEAIRRKKKKLEKLNEIVKHEFVDEDYTKTRLEMPEKIYESVEEGLKAAAGTVDEAPSPSPGAEPGKADEKEKVAGDGEKEKVRPSASDSVKNGKRLKKPVKQKEKKRIKGNLWVDDLLDESESSEEETPKKKVKAS